MVCSLGIGIYNPCPCPKPMTLFPKKSYLSPHMNYELFIAKHILFGNKKGLAGSLRIVRIAIVAVALSCTVMLVALAITSGFKQQITNKIIGLGAHIQVKSFDNNVSFEGSPINDNDTLKQAIMAVPGVGHVQPYASKAGIIKTDTDIEGVVLKGVDKSFDWSFFQQNMKAGSSFSTSDSTKSNAIVVSKITANKLKLKVGDDALLYFIQDPPRMRKLRVSGIYETGLTDFDKVFVLCDIRHIQKLNNWDAGKIGGYEVLVNDFEHLDQVAHNVNAAIGYSLSARSIKERNPQMFDWLHLQDINLLIIIILMLLVAGFNMISVLLIIILERTNMVGVLKALGSSNISIRKIFIYVASYLTVQGMLWGNGIALTLCFLQKRFQFIKLNQESYYIDHVPVSIELPAIMALNTGVLAVCLLMMVLPSAIVTKITPVKAIRFD